MAIGIVSLIGSAAAACSTGAYLPQVIRTWRTRSTHDMSLGMFAVLVMASALWLLYGIGRGDDVIIASNSLCLLLSGVILAFKLRYG
jgi:MtN3 and saliva related transmembrane protein